MKKQCYTVMRLTEKRLMKCGRCIRTAGSHSLGWRRRITVGTQESGGDWNSRVTKYRLNNSILDHSWDIARECSRQFQNS